MSVHVTVCPKCARLFAKEEGRVICQSCADVEYDVVDRIEDAVRNHAQLSVPDIAKFVGLTENEVEKAIGTSTMLAHLVEFEKVCTKCNERNTQPGSNYCLHCRLELHKNLIEMKNETLANFGRIPEPKVQGGSGMTTRDALQNKRRRAGNHRFGPDNVSVKKYT